MPAPEFLLTLKPAQIADTRCVMSIALTVAHYLNDHGMKLDMVTHPDTTTAFGSAGASRQPVAGAPHGQFAERIRAAVH